MSRTRVKICGIRTPEAALAAVDAGADAIGFMFVRSSVRAIDPEEAAAIMWGLPPMITTVGVFMNASAASFADIEEVCPTHLAQLHGNEDVDTVRACGPAIKAIRYDAKTIRNDLAYWSAIDDVDAILVDGSAGGEGTSLDWKGLAAAIEDLDQLAPLILAGGLTPDNVGEAIHTVRPFAVDVSSGVESERGVKSPELIERFCAAVRRADATS